MEEDREDVLRDFPFGATLRKLSLPAAIALQSPVCRSQPCPSASLMSEPAFHFILAAGLKQKNMNTPCSVTQGGSQPRRGACAARGGHSFMFNYSKSISSAPLGMVHYPYFSLARVLCLGEASVCWFSAAATKCFLLLPSRSPQAHSTAASSPGALFWHRPFEFP